ncbi:MAG TPA: MoaD/ThiS family protein [Acidimicrobiales bacterium]|nr:MoaD/ThiS family protein [Acidimicrobiales bacterium]
MAVLRLFAAAREAAGLTTAEIAAPTVGDVLDEACRRFGDRFVAVLGTSRLWVNGQPADRSTVVGATDVLAVLPPVSGGASPVATQGGAPTQVWTGPPTQLHPAAAPAPAAEPRPVLHPSLIVRGNLALVPDLDPDTEPATGPEAAAGAAGATAERPPLAVVHKSVRPHGRLGLAWAVVTVGAAVAGPSWLAAWLAVAAFVAGVQASVAWRKRGERPLTLVAAVVAGALPVAASFTTGAMTGVVVAGLLVAFVARLRAPSLAPSRDVALTLTIGVPIGLAAAAPVLVRQTGIAATLLLLAFASFYDAGAYLVGTGAASAWEGPAAGVVALIPVTIFASVVLIPPFSGAEPLLLGLVAAVLAPAGPVAASALLGDRSAHAPALRRLDSLLLMGPLWALCAAVMVR